MANLSSSFQLQSEVNHLLSENRKLLLSISHLFPAFLLSSLEIIVKSSIVSVHLVDRGLVQLLKLLKLHNTLHRKLVLSVRLLLVQHVQMVLEHLHSLNYLLRIKVKVFVITTDVHSCVN